MLKMLWTLTVAESDVWAMLGLAQPLAWSLTGAQDRRAEVAGRELTCNITR